MGLAIAHASADNNSEARLLLDELLAAEAPPYHVSLVFAALGEMDVAFDWMEKAVDSNQGPLADLLIDPGLDSFRTEPIRWRALLVQAGFSDELIEQAMTTR